MYIRGAKGAVVVYDITNRVIGREYVSISWQLLIIQNSFAQAKYWVEYLRKTQLAGLNNQQLIIALVGNKLDLDEDRREVEWSQGQVCLI
jgi:GTPase SAR1 family protein